MPSACATTTRAVPSSCWNRRSDCGGANRTTTWSTPTTAGSRSNAWRSCGCGPSRSVSSCWSSSARRPTWSPDIEAFVARHPLRERPRHLLIDALDATGRRAEALRVFDAYRRLLAEELGVAPSVALRARHDRLLDEDVARATRRPVNGAPVRARRQSMRRATSSMVGRDQTLAEIERQVGERSPGHADRAGRRRQDPPGARGLRAAGHASSTSGAVFCDLQPPPSESVVDAVIDAARDRGPRPARRRSSGSKKCCATTIACSCSTTAST